MARTITALFVGLSLCSPLKAEPVCVACEKPAATYACSFDQSLRDLSPDLGLKVQGHVCEKVLAKTGAHANCQIVEAQAECPGSARTVTLADYQGAMAGDVETTYEPGVLELARRQVYATWVCMTSMFNNC